MCGALADAALTPTAVVDEADTLEVGVGVGVGVSACAPDLA